MDYFVSPFNRLAFETLQKYGPEHAHPITLLYGPEGVGKTELLRNVYFRFKTNAQVMFWDAQHFSQAYTFAIQEGTVQDFRLKMRNLKILILDHLENLRGKTHTMEELLHTMDSIISQNGKVVFALRGEPQGLEFLGEKMASRIRGGLTLPIAAPSLSERMEYAHYYTRSRYLIIADEILENLVQPVQSIREIRKIIQDFVCFAEKKGEALTESCWEDFLREQTMGERQLLSPEKILLKIFAMTGVSPEEVKGNSRNPRIVSARKFAIYAFRQLLSWSYPQIGDYFGRAHSAVIKSFRQFEGRLREEPDWRMKFEALQKSFGKGISG